jgi:phage terminase large subunit-like protein
VALAQTLVEPYRETPQPLVDGDLPPTLGPVVCDWTEEMLVHGEGDVFAQPIEWEEWERRLFYRIYEYHPRTLRRIVRRVLVVLPKGTAKTEKAAAIGHVELCGPSVMGPNGPTERLSPNIPVAAASFEQADRLFGAMRTMAVEGPLKPYLEVFDTEILLKDRPGRAFRVAAVAGTNDGGLPTCFLADELHEWEGRKARVHLVIGNSLMTKRADGLEVNITTPDDADPDSLLGKLVAYGEKVAAGEVYDPSFLYVHYSAPDVNLDDPEDLRRGIRLATPASWLDVERIAARYEVDRIPPHEYRRYHLAQFVRGGGYWLPEGTWEAREQSQEVPEGTEVVLAFDGSYSGDSTALVGCTLDGYVFVIAAWERPENAPQDWIIPREEVKARVKQAMERYRVVELAPDPPGWDAEIDEWEDTYGEVVQRFETNKRNQMSSACDRFYTAVVFAQLTHDGDPRLARHLRNATVKETPAGAYITKDAKASPRKIDIAVAAVVAYDRATARREVEGPSVYEERAALVL